jgi:hypothetical protein
VKGEGKMIGIRKGDHGTGAYYRGFCKSIKWETGM